MYFAKVINNEILFAPKNYITPEGEVFVDFHMDESLMKQWGFKRLIDEPPKYDDITHELKFINISEDEENITINYEVKEKEVSQDIIDYETKLLREYLLGSMTDEESVMFTHLYPSWQANVSYVEGERVYFNSLLYKVIKDHISDENIKPSDNGALYSPIVELLSQNK